MSRSRTTGYSSSVSSRAAQWDAVFGDEVLAAAILDRLLHHSHTIVVQGDSYRLKQKRKAGLVPKATK